MSKNYKPKMNISFKEVKKMKAVFKSIILAAVVFMMVGPAFAKDLTLAWDANPEPGVIGYRVYYNNGSSSLPLNGIDAAEGPSPIDVKGQLTVTLSGLEDSEIYYFAVTAYTAEGESDFSNIVASDWMPALLSPQVDETVLPQDVVFSWSQAPAGADVAYTLTYGTDPNLPAGTLAQHTSSGQALFAGAAGLGLLGVSLASRRKKLTALTLGLAASLLIAGCGGGGGGGSDAPPAINPGDSAPTGSASAVVSGITDSTYTVSDLQPATTYYWKIVATDAQGNQRESATGSFTTGQL